MRQDGGRAASEGVRVEIIQTLPGGLHDALASTLTSAEKLLACVHTNLGEAIAVTDQRVIVMKAGALADAGMFGNKAVTYSFAELSSIEHREGLLGGHIKLLAAGVQESGPANDLSNYKRENVVTYQSRDLRDTMRAVVRIVQERIAAAHVGAAPSAAGPDLADQLLKLSALHSQGVLSDDEFAAAKSRIIG
jgi:hypothetical protein